MLDTRITGLVLLVWANGGPMTTVTDTISNTLLIAKAESHILVQFTS